MTTLNEYITRIENHDTTLTSIKLIDTRLNNADADRLMQALRNAPEIAKNITSIDLNSNQLTSINIPATLIALQSLCLGFNQLTSINIPATLIALQWLSLEDNQLTSINIPAQLIALQELDLFNNQLTSINIPATLIALQSLHLSRNQLTSINIPAQLIALQVLNLRNNKLTSINIPATLIALHILHLNNNQLTAATKIALTAFGITRPALQILIEENIPEQLTSAILDNHFKPMLEVNPDEAINYLKKIGAMHLLSHIPPELVKMLCKIEPPLEIVQANDSMNNFKNIFSMLPTLPDGANPQLDILNAYKESRFKNLLNATEKYYGSVIDSLNSVVNARRNASSSCDKVFINEFAKMMRNFSI